MLTISGLSAGYDAVDVLQRVDLAVKPGELTVLLGANGSGKTTLFRTVGGLLRPRQGTIDFDGRDITRRSADSIVKAGLAHCPEGRHLFAKMPVEKNLTLGAYVRRRKRQRVQQLLERTYQLFPVLHEKRHQPAGSLSGGQQQMVAIGRALMSDPRLLIFDEPSMGLAPLVTRQVLDAIAQINHDGIGALLAEQNASAALRIAHRGYVMSEGHVVLSGTASELLEDPEVRRAYLGV